MHRPRWNPDDDGADPDGVRLNVVDGPTALRGQRRRSSAKLSSLSPQHHKQASRGDIAGITPHLVAAALFDPTRLRGEGTRENQRPPVAISLRESSLIRCPTAGASGTGFSRWG